MDLRRVAEVKAALYAAAVGALFMVWPSILESYPEVFGGHDAGFNFGLSMMMASLLHMMALWMNGTSPRVSRYVRLLAVAWHGYMLSTFLAWFFASGAYWGALSMLYVLADIGAALHRGIWPDWRGHAWMQRP